MEFQRKTHGGIFVQKEEDIKKVKDLIKVLDEFEFDYLPQGFIQVYSSGIGYVYGHKFEFDMDVLCRECWDRGIMMWCMTNQTY